MSLSSVYARTGIPMSGVPASDARQVQATIMATGLADARGIVLNIRHGYLCQQAFAAVQQWDGGKAQAAQGQDEGARQDRRAHGHAELPREARRYPATARRSRAGPDDRRRRPIRVPGQPPSPARRPPMPRGQAQHRAAHAGLCRGRGAGRLRQRRPRPERQAARRAGRVRRRLRGAGVRRAPRRTAARALGRPADAAARGAAERPGHRHDLPAAGVRPQRESRHQDHHHDLLDDRSTRWCSARSASPPS